MTHFRHRKHVVSRCLPPARLRSWATGLIGSVVLLTISLAQDCRVRAQEVSAPAGPQATFYVAVDGNDSWSGTLPAPNADKTDGPFATLARARDAVRAVKAKGPLTRPVTVMVPRRNLLPGRNARVRPGGQRHAGLPDFVHRLSGRDAGDQRWTSHQGIVEETRGRRSGSVRSTTSEQGKWYFRQLSVNGKRQKRSRTARRGRISARRGAQRDVVQVQRRAHAEVAQPGRCRGPGLSLVERIALSDRVAGRTGDGSSSSAIRKARHTIGWNGAGGPNRYYIENTLEGSDASPANGIWIARRANSTTGRRDDLARATVVAPVLRQLIRFEGSADEGQVCRASSSVGGFTFSDTDWELPENGYPDCGDVGDIVDPSAITFAGGQASARSRTTASRTRAPMPWR